MKVLLELLPVAIGVALAGIVTWFLLDRDIGAGKWVLAALLFAHGWVHMMFVFPAPEATSTASGMVWPFDMGRSWLIANMSLDAGTIRTMGVVVIAVTFAGFLLAVLSTMGWLVPSEALRANGSQNLAAPEFRRNAAAR